MKWFRKKRKPIPYTPKPRRELKMDDPRWYFADPILSDMVTAEQQKRIKEVVFGALREAAPIDSFDYLVDRTNERIVVILEGYPQREMIAEYERRKKAFEEILALSNPLVKKIMLQKYFDSEIKDEEKDEK